MRRLAFIASIIGAIMSMDTSGAAAAACVTRRAHRLADAAASPSSGDGRVGHLLHHHAGERGRAAGVGAERTSDQVRETTP